MMAFFIPPSLDGFMPVLITGRTRYYSNFIALKNTF